MKAPIKRTAAASAIVIAAATFFLNGVEGQKLVPYQDIRGIWTDCTGNTHHVVPGQVQTKAQCDSKLAVEIKAVDAGITQCITVPMTTGQHVAFLSLAYNVGVRTVCNSNTVKRDLNHGLYTKACTELADPSWSTVAHQYNQGIHNRRVKESHECLTVR